MDEINIIIAYIILAAMGFWEFAICSEVRITAYGELKKNCYEIRTKCGSTDIRFIYLIVKGTCLILLYALFIILAAQIPMWIESAILVVKDNIWEVYGVSGIILAFEGYSVFKSEEDFRKIYYAEKKIKKRILDTFVCMTLSIGLWIGYYVLDNVGRGQSSEAFLTGMTMLFFFLLHIFCGMWTLYIVGSCRPIYILKQLPTKLHFSEYCKTSLREGDRETYRNILQSILESYDVYSKKILKSLWGKLREIEFRGHLVEKEDYWYYRAVMKLALLFFLFPFSVFWCIFSASDDSAEWGIVMILPLVLAGILYFFWIIYLISYNTKENKYKTIVYIGCGGWYYSFLYQNKLIRFKNDGWFYRHFDRAEQRYVRSVLSFLEYVHLMHEGEVKADDISRLHLALRERILSSNQYSGYELAQYRSLCILCYFAVRRENRNLEMEQVLNAESYSKQELEDFKLCIESLESDGEKERLREFLFDMTLDYYRDVDDEENINMAFMEYWVMMLNKLRTT